MSPHARPRGHTLITLFRHTLDAMVDELIERLHAAGYTDIRPAHSRVFENLDPDGTRLTTVAERARMTHPSMSELITSLEQLGYVERVNDPADGRVRMVRLTTGGRTLQRLALAEIAEIETEWTRRLGPAVGPGLTQALDHAFGETGPLRTDPLRCRPEAAGAPTAAATAGTAPRSARSR